MGSRRPPPFSLRLTFEERAKIEADAAGMSLGGYIPMHQNVETSIAGADAIKPQLGRLQRMAEGARANGLTAVELATRLDVDRWSIQPRTSELKRKRLIRDSGQRRPNCTGKLAIAWIAA